MTYLGIQTQIRRNNRNSLLLLLLFPLLLLGMVYVLILFFSSHPEDRHLIMTQTFPIVIILVLLWFIIAYFTHHTIIRLSTGAKKLERRENKRVYNLVENLCIAQGISMPQIQIIEDTALNAYASGINAKTYTVALSRGLIDNLNDAELEAVIAHELAHIQNRDTRLLIITIIFVGIFAFISEIAYRSFIYGGHRSRSRNNSGGGGVALIVVVLVTGIAYFISRLLKFGISRKREFMADAGAAEMTRNPLALASALRKISKNPYIRGIRNDDVAQLFIDHPAPKNKKSWSFRQLFATHPPIEDRIRILESF